MMGVRSDGEQVNLVLNKVCIRVWRNGPLIHTYTEECTRVVLVHVCMYTIVSCVRTYAWG